MLAMEAVKAVMNLKKVRPSDLCKALEIKSNVLSERFTQKNVSITKLNEMLHTMGYKVAILPDDTQLPDTGFEIE